MKTNKDMRPTQADTAASLLQKTYRTCKPEEIMSVGGPANFARMKGYSFSITRFENLPGEPISQDELDNAMNNARDNVQEKRKLFFSVDPVKGSDSRMSMYNFMKFNSNRFN